MSNKYERNNLLLLYSVFSYFAVINKLVIFASDVHLSTMTTPIFNSEKSLQAVLYVANRLERKDFHKIFKVLYFADMEHLNNYGRSITGDTYIAMEYGPVPSAIYDIFKVVRGDSYQWPQVDTLKRLFTVKNRYMIEPIKDADLSLLSNSDITALQNSIDEYGKLSWDEIVERSHAYAWNSTQLNSRISVEDILKEKGADAEYIDYVTSLINLQKECK